MITCANMVTLFVFFVLVYSFVNVFYKVIKGMHDIVKEARNNNGTIEDEDW